MVERGGEVDAAFSKCRVPNLCKEEGVGRAGVELSARKGKVGSVGRSNDHNFSENNLIYLLLLGKWLGLKWIYIYIGEDKKGGIFASKKTVFPVGSRALLQTPYPHIGRSCFTFL